MYAFKTSSVPEIILSPEIGIQKKWLLLSRSSVERRAKQMRIAGYEKMYRC